MRILAMRWLMLSVIAVAVVAQQTQPPTAQDDKKKKDTSKQEPQPLFGGKIPARSSQTTKESASLGFNGIDPSGKVDKKMLAASPKPQDAEKVRNMDSTRPTPVELIAFAKEGGLKTK